MSEKPKVLCALPDHLLEHHTTRRSRSGTRLSHILREVEAFSGRLIESSGIDQFDKKYQISKKSSPLSREPVNNFTTTYSRPTRCVLSVDDYKMCLSASNTSVGTLKDQLISSSVEMYHLLHRLYQECLLDECLQEDESSTSSTPKRMSPQEESIIVPLGHPGRQNTNSESSFILASTLPPNQARPQNSRLSAASSASNSASPITRAMLVPIPVAESCETTPNESSGQHVVVEGKHAKKGQDAAGFDTINNYSLLEEIGRGSFGRVMLGVDEQDNQVAIKCMPCGLKAPKHRFGWLAQPHQGVPTSPHAASFGGRASRKPSTVTRQHTRTRLQVSPAPASGGESSALREIAIMKKLRHKNIVQLKEVIHDEDDDQTFLVMDFVENGSVAEVLPDGSVVGNQCLDLEEVMAMIQQAASGLEYLHSQGVVHRDVKPENLLVGSNRDVFLADFGVAATLREDKVVDITAGTQAFFSPEICSGDFERASKYGKESDVWALGVTLYALVFAKVPFSATNVMALAKSILEDPLQLPSTRTALPSRDEQSADATLSPTAGADTFNCICDVLLGMLEKDPEKRWSLRQVRKALRTARSQRPSPIITSAPGELSTIITPQSNPLDLDDASTSQSASPYLKAATVASTISEQEICDAVAVRNTAPSSSVLASPRASTRRLPGMMTAVPSFSLTSPLPQQNE